VQGERRGGGGNKRDFGIKREEKLHMNVGVSLPLFLPLAKRLI
jgi:hypothetical protein